MGLLGCPRRKALDLDGRSYGKKKKKKKKQGNGNSTVEWNVDTTKDQRTGKMCSL